MPLETSMWSAMKGEVSPDSERASRATRRDRRLLLEDDKRNAARLRGLDQRPDPEERVGRGEQRVEAVDSLETLELFVDRPPICGSRVGVLGRKYASMPVKTSSGKNRRAELQERLVVNGEAAVRTGRLLKRPDVLVEVVVDADQSHQCYAPRNSCASSPMISWSCASPSRRIASRSLPSILKPIARRP